VSTFIIGTFFWGDFMAMSNNQSRRRGHRAVLALEMIEERILLSHGAIPGPRAVTVETVLIKTARRQRLPLSGNLSGAFSYQTNDGLNYLITVHGQGGSGNRKVGQLAFQSSFPTTLAFVTSIASQNSTVPGLTFQITAPGGSLTADGSLSIAPKSKRSPFKITARINGGTGQFAGATGNLTIQGTQFSLASNALKGKLRGTIILTS
jgi:hypothetical protein